MFLTVLEKCEDYDRVRFFMKYPDVYQTADGSIEDAIVKYQNEMKAFCMEICISQTNLDEIHEICLFLINQR